MGQRKPRKQQFMTSLEIFRLVAEENVLGPGKRERLSTRA